MSSLKEYYKKTVMPLLKERFGYKNIFEIPRLEKAIVQVGISSQAKEPAQLTEVVIDTLKRITGQMPVITKARKSISGLKVKKGMVVGAMVTLRGNRLYDFVEKLIKVVLPRVRDFRGLPFSSVDKQGNLNIGFRESIAFPEVQIDSNERLHGLGVTIVTNAKTREEGIELLKLLGFPFRESNK
jgi:large subunit ribosomal protein L5